MRDECIDVNGQSIDDPYSDVDSRFKFNTDLTYGCKKTFNYKNFRNFCVLKQWKNLVIFNQTEYMQQLGIFGNADYNNIKDWTNIINDLNLDNSFLFGDEISCYMPTSVNFDILTAQAGPLDNPQNYILGGRISAGYE